MKKSLLVAALITLVGCSDKETPSVETTTAVEPSVEPTVEISFNPDVLVGRWVHEEIPMIGDQMIEKTGNNCYQSSLMSINGEALEQPFVIEKFCLDLRKGYFVGKRQKIRVDQNKVVESEWMESEGVRIILETDDSLVKQILDSDRDFKMVFKRAKP